MGNWFHNILEITYFFLAYHDPSEKVFNLIYSSLLFFTQYRKLTHHFSFISRLYVLKLLIFIGFYPKKEIFNVLSIFDKLIWGSVDLLDKQKVTSIVEKCDLYSATIIPTLDLWIKKCVRRHPQYNLFKTTQNYNNL